MLVNNGVAFQIESLLKIYNTKSVGYFENRDQDFDRQIKDKNNAIDDYKTKMDNDEKKLKTDFMKMDKARQELEDNKNKFDNFNKQ